MSAATSPRLPAVVTCTGVGQPRLLLLPRPVVPQAAGRRFLIVLTSWPGGRTDGRTGRLIASSLSGVVLRRTVDTPINIV